MGCGFIQEMGCKSIELIIRNKLLKKRFFAPAFVRTMFKKKRSVLSKQIKKNLLQPQNISGTAEDVC